MDFTFIEAFFNGITAFMQASWEFIETGIYALFISFMQFLTKALIYSYMKFALMSLEIASGVVTQIMQETGVTALVKSSWASIPGDIQSTLGFFNIPQGLSMIFSAIPTKWAMKFIPGMGN